MGKNISEETEEFKSLAALFRGIAGRLLQAIAMYVPMTPSMRVTLQRWRRVRIGENVFLGFEVCIDPAYPELVTIDSCAVLSGRNMIYAHSDPPRLIAQTGGLSKELRPVRIRRGAWLAVGAIVLPGVTVGECAVVSAGSVVIRDIPAFTVAGGVPARVIRSLRESPGSSM
jgi:acetyltransferase-like isoleucine patch superfamily enzyme